MTEGTLPPAYRLRNELNDEVHARPPEPLAAPSRLTYLALLCDRAQRDESTRMVAAFAQAHNARGPTEGGSHLRLDVGAFRLKWERHTEFVRYTFVVPGVGPGAVPDVAVGDAPFGRTALQAVPADWIAALPGELLVAAHVLLLPERDAPDEPHEIAAKMFAGNLLVGATVSESAAVAFMDFRIHPDGFSRVLVCDRSTTLWQAGRIVQRLLEIETYRMLALLTLPVARALAPMLDQQERELSAITAALVDAKEADEPALLDRLTRLAAAIDSHNAGNQFRFSAAAAYDELVQRRIRELREARIYGVQTFREFTERRLAPAMATCRATAARQISLSEQVARTTQLLSTRVDVTREQQTQALLEQMNRRVKLQLRLQSTVEGLSVAAITYYVVSLIGHMAEGFESLGIPIHPPIAMAAAIPVVAGLMFLGLRRVHRLVGQLD
jgi:uncharacterized membrane-anchored protein